MADLGELLFPVELDPFPIRKECLAGDPGYRAEELARLMIFTKMLADVCPSVDHEALIELVALMIEDDELRLRAIRPERGKVPPFSLALYWKAFVEGVPRIMTRGAHSPEQSETIIRGFESLWDGKLHFRLCAWVPSDVMGLLP